MKNQYRFPDNGIRICIDTNPSCEFLGRIYGVTLADTITYHNRAEFVVKVDDAFNVIGRPQAHQIIRSFKDTHTPEYNPYNAKPVHFYSDADIRNQHGKYATIDLVMISRQHTEWQGLLKNDQGETVANFSSVLQCVEAIVSLIDQE